MEGGDLGGECRIGSVEPVELGRGIASAVGGLCQLVGQPVVFARQLCHLLHRNGDGANGIPECVRAFGRAGALSVASGLSRHRMTVGTRSSWRVGDRRLD